MGAAGEKGDRGESGGLVSTFKHCFNNRILGLTICYVNII